MLTVRVLRLQQPACRAAVTCAVREWVKQPIIVVPQYHKAATRQQPYQATTTTTTARNATNIQSRCCSTQHPLPSALDAATTLWPQTQQQPPQSEKSTHGPSDASAAAALYQHALSLCLSDTRATRRIQRWERLAVAVSLLDELVATTTTTTAAATSLAHDDELLDNSIVSDMLRAILHACEPLTRHTNSNASSVATRVLLQYTQAAAGGGGDDTGTASIMHAAMAKLLPDTTVQPHSMRVPLSPELYTQLVRVWAKRAASGNGNAVAFDAAVALCNAAEQYHTTSDPSWPLEGTVHEAMRACESLVGATSNRVNVRRALDQSVTLLRQLQNAGGTPTATTYTGALAVCSTAAARGETKALPVALELLREAAAVGGSCAPTTAMYNSMMRVCAAVARFTRSEAVELAVRLLDEMAAGGRRAAPTTKVYTSAINVCANAVAGGDKGALRVAVDILHEAASTGGAVEPNAATYTATIKACAAAALHGTPGAVQLAVKLLRDMKARGGKAEPVTVSYNAAILACANAAAAGGAGAKHVHTAVALLREAAEQGGKVTPNIVTYSTVIKACAGAARHSLVPGAIELSVQLLRSMAEAGDAVRPNSTTYATIINACARSCVHGDTAAWQTAVDLVHEARSKCHEGATSAMYSTAIRACAESARQSVPGACTAMVGLLDELQTQTSVPLGDALTFGVVLDALAVGAEDDAEPQAWQRAVAMVRGLGSSSSDSGSGGGNGGGGVRANETMYNTVLKACVNARQPAAFTAMLEVLDEMRAAGLQPSAYTYSTLIDGYAGPAGDGDAAALDAAVSLLHQATAAGGAATPNEHVYGAVFKVCVAAVQASVPEALQQLQRVFAEVQNAGVQPNAVMFRGVVLGCAAAAAANGDNAALQQAAAFLGAAADADSSVWDGGSERELDDLYLAVLRLCARAARQGATEAADVSVALLQDLTARRGGLEPSQLAYVLAIRAQANAAAAGDGGALKAAFALLREAAAGGDAVAPNAPMFVGVVLTCVNAAAHGEPAALELALKLLQRMQAAGGSLAPTSRTYCKVLDAHAAAVAQGDAQALTTALQVLREAHGSDGDDSRAEVIPSVFMYNSVLQACAEAAAQGMPGALQQAMELLQEQRVAGNEAVAPNRRSFTWAITACARHMEQQGAGAVFQQAVDLMHEAAAIGGAAAPDTVLYNAFLGACAAAAGHGDEQAAALAVDTLQLMKASELESRAPDADTYAQVMRACAADERPAARAAGMAVVAQFCLEERCEPNASSVEACQELCGAAGRVAEFEAELLPALVARGNVVESDDDDDDV